MSTKAETRFKLRIRPIIESLPNTWIAKIQQVAIRGTPDFLCCINGSFVAIELKATAKDKQSPLQAWTHQKILDAKGVSLVVSPETWPEVLPFLTALAEGCPRDQIKVPKLS